MIVELKEAESAAPVPEMPATPASISRAPGVTLQGGESARSLSEILQNIPTQPHWPMYLRGFKQFLRSADPAFDERRLGFSNIHELLRQAQRENLVRIERNRQGVIRIMPGERFSIGQQDKAAIELQPAPSTPIEVPALAWVDTPAEPLLASPPEAAPEPQSEIEVAAAAAEPRAEEKPKRRRRTSASSSSKRRATWGTKPRSARKTSAESQSEG